MAGIGFVGLIVWWGHLSAHRGDADQEVDGSGISEITIALAKNVFYRGESLTLLIANYSDSTIYTSRPPGFELVNTLEQDNLDLDDPFQKNGGCNAISSGEIVDTQPLIDNQPATTFLSPGNYKAVLFYWTDSPSCSGFPNMATSEAFRVVDRYPSFSDLCNPFSSIPVKVVPLHLEESVLNQETLVVCGRPVKVNYGYEEKAYVIDEKGIILWHKSLESGRHLTTDRPEAVDVDNNGLDEIYWRSNGCGGGLCSAECFSTHHLYSRQYDEEFTLTKIWKYAADCKTPVMLPTFNSQNLEDQNFSEFKDYLTSKVTM